MHYNIVADLALYNSACMLLEHLDLATRVPSLPLEYQRLLTQLRSDIDVAAIAMAIPPWETRDCSVELAWDAVRETMDAIDAFVQPLLVSDAVLASAWRALYTSTLVQQQARRMKHVRSFQEMLGHWHEPMA